MAKVLATRPPVSLFWMPIRFVRESASLGMLPAKTSLICLWEHRKRSQTLHSPSSNSARVVGPRLKPLATCKVGALEVRVVACSA